MSNAASATTISLTAVASTSTTSSAAPSSTALVCYIASYNYAISSNQYFPCGASDNSGASAQACCVGEDYCMQDGICHYTHGGVTNGTGYYMAGCTDPTWKDPACPKQCTSEYSGDIIYDKTNSEWRCCTSSEGSLDCQDPSDFIVKGADPNDLPTILQLSTPLPTDIYTSTIGSIKSANTAPTSATSRPTSKIHNGLGSSPTHAHASNSLSPGLSTGAEAGIAMGAISGVVVAALLAIILVRRFRKGNSSNKDFQKFPSFDKSQDKLDTAKPDIKVDTSHLDDDKMDKDMPPRAYSFAAAVAGQQSKRSTTSVPRSSSMVKRDVRRDSEFPWILENAQRNSQRASEIPLPPSVPESALTSPSKRFSYEDGDGPYEMQSQESLRSRNPYERPGSAMELEGTKVHPQELDDGPPDKTWE